MAHLSAIITYHTTCLFIIPLSTAAVTWCPSRCRLPML